MSYLGICLLICVYCPSRWIEKQLDPILAVVLWGMQISNFDLQSMTGNQCASEKAYISKETC